MQPQPQALTSKPPASRRRHTRARGGPLALLIAITLSACAPTTTSAPPAANATITPTAATFYPHQTGQVWHYLNPGDPITSPAYHLSVRGPSIHQGERVTLTTLHGRGLDITYYHQHDHNGVHLHREQRPQLTIDYHPPLSEYPPSEHLQIGHEWSGTTTATLTHPDQRSEQHDIHYTGRALERQRVSTPAGEFDAILIEFITESEAQRTRQEIWFVPHYGALKHRLGFVLSASNITPPKPQ